MKKIAQNVRIVLYQKHIIQQTFKGQILEDNISMVIESIDELSGSDIFSYMDINDKYYRDIMKIAPNCCYALVEIYRYSDEYCGLGPESYIAGKSKAETLDNIIQALEELKQDDSLQQWLNSFHEKINKIQKQIKELHAKQLEPMSNYVLAKIKNKEMVTKEELNQILMRDFFKVLSLQDLKDLKVRHPELFEDAAETGKRIQKMFED
jgi:nitrogen regulatory protein PII-like uncharacterized protein